MTTSLSYLADRGRESAIPQRRDQISPDLSGELWKRAALRGIPRVQYGASEAVPGDGRRPERAAALGAVAAWVFGWHVEVGEGQKALACG